ncbi:XRE family transcriptional regulator [Streptomyces sp. So13.3]|uniref:DUF5753 domain-containing protein n=1 Tax=Streptomyces TaxID=1883 RepID=UPI0011060F4D|nr:MULTISPECIES: DUF5753 domain-containing protein [Streptomyces]MCZ4097029.1 DUF5753 domain-containing protein [Streptomyces sp. H39-C1]QNA74730.1 XRE family transcriptional regulator [Streptomyces sp. So13.3]
MDFAELETSSAAIKTFQVMFVPGMLQTAAYTRALFAAGEPNAEPALFDRYVQFRQRRKQVLTGDSPPQFHAVIHETAIRMSFVGVDVLREQLEHLIEMALMPHVHIQIMPLAAPVFPAVDKPFVIYDPGLSELSTVHVEHPVSTAFLSEQSYLAQYADAFDRLTSSALAPLDPKSEPGVFAKRDSIGLIQHLLYLL